MRRHVKTQQSCEQFEVVSIGYFDHGLFLFGIAAMSIGVILVSARYSPQASPARYFDNISHSESEERVNQAVRLEFAPDIPADGIIVWISQQELVLVNGGFVLRKNVPSLLGDMYRDNPDRAVYLTGHPDARVGVLLALHEEISKYSGIDIESVYVTPS